MGIFRFVCSGIFAAALLYVFFLDTTLWEKLFILAVTAAPLVMHEFQLRKRKIVAAEQAAHASNSVPDQIFHAYQEPTRNHK